MARQDGKTKQQRDASTFWSHDGGGGTGSPCQRSTKQRSPPPYLPPTTWWRQANINFYNGVVSSGYSLPTLPLSPATTFSLLQPWLLLLQWSCLSLSFSSLSAVSAFSPSPACPSFSLFTSLHSGGGGACMGTLSALPIPSLSREQTGRDNLFSLSSQGGDREQDRFGHAAQHGVFKRQA